MEKWIIVEKETQERISHLFDTFEEAKKEFESEGGDYDYYKIEKVLV